MRAAEPGRGEISSAKNLALRNDVVVDLRGGVVGEKHRGACESREEILEEMEFEEVVENGEENERCKEKIVAERDEREDLQKKPVSAGRRC